MSKPIWIKSLQFCPSSEIPSIAPSTFIFMSPEENKIKFSLVIPPPVPAFVVTLLAVRVFHVCLALVSLSNVE